MYNTVNCDHSLYLIKNSSITLPIIVQCHENSVVKITF